MNRKYFETKEQAEKVINYLNRGTYYLSHGEIDRPSYAVRHNKNGYYIRIKCYFYKNTFNTRYPSCEWADLEPEEINMALYEMS